MQPQKMEMRLLSDFQQQYIREHVRWTFHYLKGECVVRYGNSEHNLRTLEACIAQVLGQVAECLPPSTYEHVKRLLDARQRLWDELNPPDPDPDFE